jgi:hypothetical protein
MLVIRADVMTLPAMLGSREGSNGSGRCPYAMAQTVNALQQIDKESSQVVAQVAPNIHVAITALPELIWRRVFHTLDRLTIRPFAYQRLFLPTDVNKAAAE